jgi:hypothetical protein
MIPSHHLDNREQISMSSTTENTPLPAPTGTPVPPPPSPSAPSVDQRVMLAEAAALGQAKSTGVAYLLWFFLGVFGAHKFYLGRVGMGFAYLFTLGFLSVGLWIDLFTLPRQIRQANAVRRAEIRTQMGV